MLHLIDKRNEFEMRRIEGDVIFGHLHGRVRINQSGGRMLCVEMCLGVVCGPVQLYVGYVLEKVVSADQVWEFESRVVKSASLYGQWFRDYSFDS